MRFICKADSRRETITAEIMYFGWNCVKIEQNGLVYTTAANITHSRGCVVVE